jgi:hypothetical protein
VHTVSPGGLGAVSFEVFSDGTVAIDPSDAHAAWATANEVHFVTVPITLDPADYVGLWSLHGGWYTSGVQTLNVVPGRNSVSPGGIHVATFQVASDGTITVDPVHAHKATATGSTLTFTTHDVLVQVGDYVDLCSLHGDTAWRSGDMLRHLPSGRYWLQAGFGRAIFDVAPDGVVSVVVGWEHAATATADGIEMVTETVFVDPGAHTGQWGFQGTASWRSGAQLVALMPGRLAFTSRDVSTLPWMELSSPCALDVDSYTDDDGNTFTFTCAEDLDTDADDDGIDDVDDLCPDTPVDLAVTDDGCSGQQWVDLECPTDSAWANHGDYVSCVVAVANDLKSDGVLTPQESADLKSAAAQASVP